MLKGKSLHVGLPLRPDYVKGKVSQADARQYYLLASDRPVVLIFGGSQGSGGINDMVTKAFDKVSANLQVLHFTGNSRDTAKLKRYYETLGLTCCVKDFEERMDLAWQAADWVISRSGAASIAEQVAFGVPGILIPYPFATDNHQEINADHFVHQVKGGLKILENQSSSKELVEAINRMIQPEELTRYKKNIAAYQNEVTTLDFVEEIMALIGKNT
jgi:UDP-N-acetylglucosamine--N-acetylmuramyl-(pentapeptide) pyrophosphoryl-undecaprenol N-acetylglucosamine transferase